VAHHRDEKRKRADTKARSQQEIDAQVIREKIARLRELRLAYEAANNSTTGVVRGGGHTAINKKPRKSDEKPLPLSEWLATQNKEGRRN
jgi:hypothetical protein